MTTPLVREQPLRLEPVVPDPFLAGLEPPDPGTEEPARPDDELRQDRADADRSRPSRQPSRARMVAARRRQARPRGCEQNAQNDLYARFCHLRAKPLPGSPGSPRFTAHLAPPHLGDGALLVGGEMLVHRIRRVAAGLAVCALAAGAGACGSANEAGSGAAAREYPDGRLSIMAPADPGGGWDKTARALQDIVRKSRLVKTCRGLQRPRRGRHHRPRPAGRRAGRRQPLMVMGLVMVGAIAHEQVAGRRWTRRHADRHADRASTRSIVVPADSPVRDPPADLVDA